VRTRREKEVIILDYGDFREVDFEECQLVYKGGTPPTLINCKLNKCVWHFEGEARNTLSFIKSLASDEGSREFVLQQMLGLST
jgi:hypothetical protein